MNLILKMFYWIYSFSNICLILLIVVGPIIWKIICKFVLEKWKLNPKIWRAFCTVLLLFLVFNILYVTIGMRNYDVRIVRLTPFYSIVGMSIGAIQSSLLNAVMFEPIGLLVPNVFGKESCGYDGVWKEIVVCILISVAIEMIQYIFQLGTVETDDVIFNTLGYVIGRGGTLGLATIWAKSRKSEQCNTKI